MNAFIWPKTTSKYIYNVTKIKKYIFLKMLYLLSSTTVYSIDNNKKHSAFRMISEGSWDSENCGNDSFASQEYL